MAFKIFQQHMFAGTIVIKYDFFFSELPHVTSIEWVTLTLTIMSHINSKCKPYGFFPPLLLRMASCYFLNADLNLNPAQHLNIFLGWGTVCLKVSVEKPELVVITCTKLKYILCHRFPV